MNYLVENPFQRFVSHIQRNNLTYWVHYESNAHFLGKIDLLMRLLQMVKNIQNSLLLHQYTGGDDSATRRMHPGTPRLECLSRAL